MGTSGLVPKIKDDDWVSVRQAIAKLSTKLGPKSNPTYAGLTLTGLTASRLIASDASKALVSSDLASWVAQTANQVLVADDGDGTITLSTPQDIHTGATPTFENVHISSGETYSLILEADTNEYSQDYTLTFNIGESNKTIHMTGTTTLDDWFNQDVKTNASPTFVGLNFNFASQDYLFTNRGGSFFILQSQTSNLSPQFEIFTKDGDGVGGENVAISLWGKGTPGDITTTAEALAFNYTPTGCLIYTYAAGSGTVRSLSIYTGTNTTQLVLATNNDIAMSGDLAVTGEVLGGTGKFAYIGIGTTPNSAYGIYDNTTHTSTHVGYNQNLKLAPDAGGQSLTGLAFLIGAASSVEDISGLTGMTGAIVMGINNLYTGTIANAVGVQAQIEIKGNTAIADPDVTNAYLFKGIGITTGVGPSIVAFDNAYGLYLPDINIGDTLNYAIYTNAGDVYFGDKVGIGVASPTEALDINGRIELTQQSGSTNDGALWNDSTQKALQTFTSGIEQTLVGVIFTQTADQTIANTTTETTLFGTGVGTLTLPANFWVVGKTIRIEIHGDFADTGNPTAQIRVKLDAVELSDSTAITLSGLGGTEEWETEVIITCRSVGGSGTLETVVDWEYETTTGSSAIERLDIGGTLQTVDTTQSDTLDVTFAWGTANALNTLTSEVGFVTVLN